MPNLVVLIKMYIFASSNNLIANNMDMKKLFVWAIMALPVLAACDSGEKIDDVEEEGGSKVEVTMKTLAGEWYINLNEESESSEETLTIKNDGSYVSEMTWYQIVNGKKEIRSQYRSEGTFKLDGTLLTGTVTKSQSRHSNWVDGVYQGLSEWEDNEYYDSYGTVQVSLLRNGSLLVLESYMSGSDQMPGYEPEATFYFKKGAKLPSDKSEIQGTWYWYSLGMIDDDKSAVRVAVKFDGDNIDMVITPWGARYTGKYTYKDGIVKIGKTTFYTSREKDGYGGDMNYENPYATTTWRIPGADDYYQNGYPDGFSFPFVVSGKKAYSRFVGLTPIYTKQ